jgi:putative sterol carrier protein
MRMQASGGGFHSGYGSNFSPDGASPNNAYVYLDLYHGECRRALYADSLDGIPKAVYAYKGAYSNWRRLIENQIDPIQGLLTGKFRLDGSLMEIMKYIRAAKEMVSTATTVQTEF